MFGGAGIDRLDGRGGNDQLGGGAGNDILIGGAEFDTADYALAAAAISVNLLNSKARDGDGGTDSLATIENINGSRFADLIVGNNIGNRISGGTGDDLFDGLGGNDVLIGGLGNDRLFGFDGSDNLNGGVGPDRLTGGAGADILRSGVGNDVYFINDSLEQVFETAMGGSYRVVEFHTTGQC